MAELCWSAGLGAVGVALVASAAMRLTFSTCKCKTTMIISLLVIDHCCKCDDAEHATLATYGGTASICKQ